jgi:hypothetical protein
MRIDPSWFALAPALIAGESDIAEMCSLIVEPDGSLGTGRAPACHKRCSIALLAATLVSGQAVGSGAENLTFAARGAVASGWEPGAAVVQGHEPARGNDGRFHTCWMAHSENLPADLGVEWTQPQRISGVIQRNRNHAPHLEQTRFFGRRSRPARPDARRSRRTPDLVEFRLTQVCTPGGDPCPEKSSRWP